MALCPRNGLRCSRYALRSPIGFVEQPGPPRRAEKGSNLAVSGNHLVAGQVAVLRTPLVIGASSTPGISCLQKTVITSVAAVWRPPAVYTLHKDNRMCPRLIVCTLLLALGVGRSSVPLALAGRRRRPALPCPPTSSPRSPRWDPGSSRFAGRRKALPLRGSRARHGTAVTLWNRP